MFEEDSLVYIFDDYHSPGHFAYMRFIHPGTYGEARPAVGDVDGDGRAEIVVGCGYYGRGRLVVLNDAFANYSPMTWLQVPWANYTTTTRFYYYRYYNYYLYVSITIHYY